MSKRQAVDDFLEKNPQGTYKEFVDSYPDGISSSFFGKTRNKFLKRKTLNKPSESKHRRKIDYTEIDAFIRENPTASFREFHRKIQIPHKDSSTHIVSQIFYARRIQITGSTKTTTTSDQIRRRQLIYMSIWSYDTSKMTNETRAALESLVGAINKDRKLNNWQLIELKSPAIMELRQVSH